MAKTAMQLVFEKYQEDSVTLGELGTWVARSIYLLLQKEKQQIVDAFDDGQANHCKPVDFETGEQYYNETYKAD